MMNSNGKCFGHMVLKTLLVVGGLNWGLVGLGMLFGNGDAWNVVKMILGSMPTLEAVIYLLVGLAAAMKLFGGCFCAKCKVACENCDTCPAK